MFAVLGYLVGIASVVLCYLGVFTDKGTSRADTADVQTADTLFTDTSYMWLDTTHGEYHIADKDTLVIYSYHTNGMSAMLRISNIADSKLPARIIYQDTKGFPRAIMGDFEWWLCLDRAYMDKIIHDRDYGTKTYYQALFYTGYDRFRFAKNPIACESMDW
jgi:hypothetical protein